MFINTLCTTQQKCYEKTRHELSYNPCHKSLKQKPFVLNLLKISYIHSSHLCSHSNVPLSFPNVELSVFWTTEMTANPNQHRGGKNHTNVSRFVMSIVAHMVLLYPTSPFLLLSLCLIITTTTRMQ